MQRREVAFVDELRKLRLRYQEDRYLFISGKTVEGLLLKMGATAVDFDRLRHVSEATLRRDPTLPFRRTRNGRYCVDAKNGEVFRLEDQSFVLSGDEDFVRHDSGILRRFDPIGEELESNTAFVALMRLKAALVAEMEVLRRPNLDYGQDANICTVFNIRTTTSRELAGEPALEGVHSDGVDHTMSTFLGSENMTRGSARTFLHDRRERNGIRWHEADPALVRANYRHDDFLDTLLVVDHEFKHSVTPLAQEDQDLPSTRDVLIFFTRRPYAATHRFFDSEQAEKAHPNFPERWEL